MDEQLLTILARLCHFFMSEYISRHSMYHVPDGHMTEFPTDYIKQG
jgi:hypothetical protein